MHSAEYEELLGSLRKIVRQAYDLGRSEALKQVVEVLKTDPVPPKPLRLAAPDPQAAQPMPEPAMAVAEPARAEPVATHAKQEPMPGLVPGTPAGGKPADGPANHSSQPPTTHTRAMPDQAPVQNSAPAEPRKEPLSPNVLGTPAKPADAPARAEEKPAVPWWAR